MFCRVKVLTLNLIFVNCKTLARFFMLSTCDHYKHKSIALIELFNAIMLNIYINLDEFM